MSEWEETFLAAYLELGRVIRQLVPQTTTAFTATALGWDCVGAEVILVPGEERRYDPFP